MKGRASAETSLFPAVRSVLTPDTIEALQPVIAGVARNVARRLPPHVRASLQDDLVNEGWCRVLATLPRFDANRGVPLVAYVRQQAGWAMLDCLRAEREPFGISRHRGVEAVRVADDATGTLRDRSSSPYAATAAREELRQVLARATPRHRRVALAVAGGHTTRHVANTMGVSKTRISQICAGLRMAAACN